MSEALSSSEIEDVLSSIRRLVSDDMRPAAKGADPAATEAGQLLLTPALRVVPSDSVGQTAEEPALDAVVLALGAGMSQQPDDWESEVGDLAPVGEAGADGQHALAAQDWEDHQIDAYAEAVPQPVVMQDVLVEAPQAAPTDSFADDDSADALPGWAQSSGAEAAEDPQPAPWTDGTVEPDPIWAEQAEAAVIEELAAAGPMPQMGSDSFVMNDADAAEVPVDEAMLREIVRDVLREELQGRLGERITRNIRKLVRAEIARVMATEGFL